MTTTGRNVDLRYFIKDALRYAITPYLSMGDRFLSELMERCYLKMIRDGWAVPLSVFLDITSLIVQPHRGFVRGRFAEAGHLGARYYRLLRRMRDEPDLQATIKLFEETSDPAGRLSLLSSFHEFLFESIGRLSSTYAFTNRGITYQQWRAWKRAGSAGGQAGNVVLDLMGQFVDYYRDLPLKQVFNLERRFLLQVSARFRTGLSHVDLLLLKELFGAPDLPEREIEEPRPPTIMHELPTDSYESGGVVGGFTDLQRSLFDGRLSEVLHSELSTYQHKSLFYHRLVNEGVQQFVREKILCLEKELRILLCFVIDVDERMMVEPTKLSLGVQHRASPYVRARKLAALMTKDVAQWMPRTDVRVDLAIYLWSQRAPVTFRAATSLFDHWPEAAAHDRFEFAVGMLKLVPHLFTFRVGKFPASNPRLGIRPLDHVEREKSTQYHNRHVVHFTSAATQRGVLSDEKQQLRRTGDSLFVVDCGTNAVTLRVDTSDSADHHWVEDTLRSAFLDTVVAKAVGKSRHAEWFDLTSG